MGPRVQKELAKLSLLLIAFATISCGENTLFTKLEPEETGVTFVNEINENDSLNIIEDTNIYNGGGVAVADFNNDGRQDIYFTGNMVRNELYLNQGDFQFRNVTDDANVGAEERWSSGVAAVDINSDGLMDLYICATTYDEPSQRANQLYINQGVNEQNVPVFKEMAAEYNLADTSNTTMAAFFDYDNDQDLDVYLLINKFTRNSSLDSYHEKMTEGQAITTDRLYRNNGSDSLGHPHFTDVSDEAGILMEGFGLGVNITDLNKDGWKDIYVSNDFITNEVVYMNNGDGTFTDRASELFKHTVNSAMGNDVADINNDGHPDVIMVDMRPESNYRKKKMLRPNDYRAYINNERYNYDYQYVRNQLHLYRGKNPQTGLPLFSDIGIYSGISETDWSWTPSVADFDNDGWRDIVITNGFPKDVTDHDFEDYVNEVHTFMSTKKLLDQAPSVKLSNYAFRNNGDLTFEDATEEWGMDIPSFSNGAVQVDLDNDGDLDYVVNNINHPAFVFKNNQAEMNSEQNHYLRIRFQGEGGNTMGLGAIAEIEFGGGKTQYYEHTTYRGYLSTLEPFAHFGLGEADSVDKLTVTWPNGSSEVIRNIEANQVLTVDIQNATETKPESALESPGVTQTNFRNVTDEVGIDYEHQERDFNDFNVQQLLPHKLSQYGPGLAVGDVNGDGLDDLYVSGAFEYKGKLFIQQQDGTFLREDLLEGNNPENSEEELGSLFFDADGDGDDDLYVVSGSYEHEFGNDAYQDRLFINENGKLTLDEDALPEYFLASGSAVRAADFDKDGDLDLFVGGRVHPHEYPKPVDSYLLENVTQDGTPKFEIVNSEKAPVLQKIGMISDALWTDFNNDGWIDLILAGEWMSLRFLQNNSGQFVDVTDQTGIADAKGWWNSLCAGDFDNDGDTDYVAGNLGTNTYNQASEEYPLRVYGNDFDRNNRYDVIPTIYNENSEGNKVEVPFHGRTDMGEQIPSTYRRFDSYHKYATLTIDQILANYDTTGTVVEQATHMETSYIENLGDGSFSVTPMAGKLQWAPVYGCISEDLNNDGNQDLMVVGNDYGTEVSTGRYDALNGLVLHGNGDGTFDIRDFVESGFFVPGDAKALVKLRGANDSYLVAASQNRGPLKLFKSGNTTIFQAEPNDVSAIINYDDGSSSKKEFYYGSSFLSSSGRFIPISDQVISLEVTTYSGDTRTVTFE